MPSLEGVYRGLDNRIYYMLAPEGEYYNYTGCGNTLNCNHPVVRRFIVDCLRYWVEEMHIDGFRFDLASIMTRAHSEWSSSPAEPAPAETPGAVCIQQAAFQAGGAAVDTNGWSAHFGMQYLHARLCRCAACIQDAVGLVAFVGFTTCAQERIAPSTN